MLIQDKDKKFPPFHEPAAKGAYLIDTGKFVQVFPTITPKQAGSLTWSAVRGPAVADTELPPCIFYSACPACKSEGGYVKGPTAHLTQRVFHCNAFENVPQAVGEEYVRLYQEFRNRQARKQRLAD